MAANPVRGEKVRLFASTTSSDETGHQLPWVLMLWDNKHIFISLLKCLLYAGIPLGLYVFFILVYRHFASWYKHVISNKSVLITHFFS